MIRKVGLGLALALLLGTMCGVIFLLHARVENT